MWKSNGEFAIKKLVWLGGLNDAYEQMNAFLSWTRHQARANGQLRKERLINRQLQYWYICGQTRPLWEESCKTMREENVTKKEQICSIKQTKISGKCNQERPKKGLIKIS